MSYIRRLLAQRHFVVLLCAATLLLKLLVPAGYMIGSEHGRPTIELCSGVAPQPRAMGMPGMHGGMPDHGRLKDHGYSKDHGHSRDHGRAEMPCAFSGLSAVSLAAVDLVQLAALIAFVMSIGLVAMALPPPSRREHLRPPLRGPPAAL